ncbi:GNAT family N-acetyltransferase [Pedobacter sp. MR22-3]|uniref:GNAT family N-acetyltransferase n=1 Tax=Pedobacter sp. MR22-3 TaxID=2994552 RepID=UPI0022464E08|nr:GNAT family N-acetyltransferase [Pedobacter sp. MR22-3]MCX2584770.1 GNAT family N-acetyltransferase [Pedobacter sp. MR22-3]
MEIIELLPLHWEEVRIIYLQGIATKQATFQTDAPAWEEWDNGHLAGLRYVAIIDGNVAGWAALTSVSGRCVYAGVTEVSVYIHEAFRGKGVGKALLQNLVTESEASNIWTLQSGIFPENTASIALHEKLGFRKIGYREKIGKMDGVWRDTVLMERRSKITGQE